MNNLFSLVRHALLFFVECGTFVRLFRSVNVIVGSSQFRIVNFWRSTCFSEILIISRKSGHRSGPRRLSRRTMQIAVILSIPVRSRVAHTRRMCWTSLDIVN